MMKKIAVVLLALLMTAPVMADVVISVAAGPGPNDVTISYDASGEGEAPRAFALEIDLTDPETTIEEVNCVNADYHVYIGSISISGEGEVTGEGSCDCGGDSNSVCIEMGSIEPDPAPALTGDLVILTLGGCTPDTGEATVAVAEKVISGGVVMEDPEQEVTVDSPGGAVAVALGNCRIPNCQDPIECAGHASGDATCDGSVNLGDLLALKAVFGEVAPWTDPECCSDFDNNGAVNLGDLLILKPNFGALGLVPATGIQVCLPAGGP
jgi:hypothetical protein